MKKTWGKFLKGSVYTILDASMNQVNLPGEEERLFLCNLVDVDDPGLVAKYGTFVEFVDELPDLNSVKVIKDIDTILQYEEKK
jgi:hypothetical protein